MSSVTPVQWKARQERINAFVQKRLKGVAPLKVDGKAGPTTNKLINACRWWLGYNVRSADWDDQLDYRLRHPFDPTRTTPAMLARGIARRKRHNDGWTRTHQQTTGVGYFDGHPVAAWIIPYLTWARAHGWPGVVLSGYRTPAYSTSLCEAMCHAPRCPGLCAGATSNHSGLVKPHGAVDTTYPEQLRAILQHCPLRPLLTNHLPADHPHSSVSGN